MDKQLLIHQIANDEIKIMKEYNNIENANQDSKGFYNKVYVLICKIGLLKNIIEEAKHLGVSFENHPIGFLDDMFDELCEMTSFQDMEELSPEEEQSINDFALKYADLMPEEFMEDLLDLD